MKQLLFLCAITLLFSSCLTQKVVEYKGIENVSYKTENNTPQITFDLVINNPNNWGLRLSDLNSQVFVADHMIGNALLQNTIKIKRKSYVYIPISLNLSMSDVIALIPTGLSLFGKKSKVNTAVDGDLVLKKFLFKKKYKVNFKQDITLDLK
jgi:LEA14-like dessication related protein